MKKYILFGVKKRKKNGFQKMDALCISGTDYVSCKPVSLTDLYDYNLPLFIVVCINMHCWRLLRYYSPRSSKPVYVMKWCTPNPYTDTIKQSIIELWFVFIDRSLKFLSYKNIIPFVIQLRDDKNVAKVMSMSATAISVVIPVFLTHRILTQGIRFCIIKWLQLPEHHTVVCV